MPTYCPCGRCESSRRGMVETGRKYRVPEPPLWLHEEESVTKAEIYRVLKEEPTWDEADDSERAAFIGAMKSRTYGYEEVRSAWEFFDIGWRSVG